MVDAGNWERLAGLLDDDDLTCQAVRAAVQAGEDPWEALLDALDDAGVLAYLQLGDTGMELADALAQLPRVFSAQTDLDAVTDVDDLQEATRVADAALEIDGLQIIRLIEDDDAWPLVVVPGSRAGQIIEMAERIGRRLVSGR